MKPRSMFRPVSRTLIWSPTSTPSCPVISLALDRRLQQPNPGPFFGGTGDQSIEGFPNAAGEELRRGGFPHLTLHLLGRIFLLGAMRRQRRQLRRVIGKLVARQGGFQQSLGNQVGKSAVRCGGMAVFAARPTRSVPPTLAREVERHTRRPPAT